MRSIPYVLSIVLLFGFLFTAVSPAGGHGYQERECQGKYKGGGKPTTEELSTILAHHSAWLKSKPRKEDDEWRADLCEADLSDATLLYHADLQRAHLEGTNLQAVNLGYANLQEAYLHEAKLEGAHLDEANLQGAHLEGAHLQGTDLYGAHLQGAHLEEDVDLREAYLLTLRGNSEKGVSCPV